MRVLLDSCVPHRLRHDLAGHVVETARYARLEGLLDGALLDAMQGRFDVLLTCDQGIPWQQNMKGRTVSVLVMLAQSNRLPDLLPLVPEVLEALKAIGPGEAVEVR